MTDILKRLREEAQIKSGSSFRNGCPDCGMACNLLDECIDEIERLRREIKEQRCDGIKTGLEMADKYVTLAGNIEDAQSMIKVAIATVEDT